MNIVAANNLLSIPDLIITRTFDASRALVWQTWTDPQHVAQWWGPHDFTNPLCEWDAKVGNKILIHMPGHKGSIFDFEMPMHGEFIEVVAPERLVFKSSAMADANGNDQLEVRNTITFGEVNGKTKMTLHAVVMKSSLVVAGALAGMEQGWLQSLDKLTAMLEELLV